MTDQPSATLQLLPFRGVRYRATPAQLGSLIAPPYDVIDETQRQVLEARDPHNAVRIILPREPADGSDRYAAAAQYFEQWLDDDTLAVDEAPALYVYQQSVSGVVLQRGLLGAIVMQPLDGGVILPHENVRKGPVEDRLALMRALEGNPEPIFLLYEGGGPASDISAAAVAEPALSSTQTPDGVDHQLWAITDPELLAAIAADLATRRAMIADGHHRYTTYGYLRDERYAAGAGNGPWDAGLTLLVDDSVATPDIHAIHRVVPGRTLAAATELAARAFRVEPLDVADVDAALAALRENQSPSYVITDGTTFVLLTAAAEDQLAAARPAQATGAWWALDASIASAFVLGTLWGVSDAAGEVEAEHDPNAAVRLARDAGGVALLLKPAPLASIMAVAIAGEAMPRKSTLFLPKPASGLVMRSFRFEK